MGEFGFDEFTILVSLPMIVNKDLSGLICAILSNQPARAFWNETGVLLAKK